MEPPNEQASPAQADPRRTPKATLRLGGPESKPPPGQNTGDHNHTEERYQTCPESLVLGAMTSRCYNPVSQSRLLKTSIFHQRVVSLRLRASTGERYAS